jgi:hypothetical protein
MLEPASCPKAACASLAAAAVVLHAAILLLLSPQQVASLHLKQVINGGWPNANHCELMLNRRTGCAIYC